MQTCSSGNSSGGNSSGGLCFNVAEYSAISPADRCTGAGGTVSGQETCDMAVDTFITMLTGADPLAAFAQGAARRPAPDCGGFGAGNMNINFHLFRAGRACCQDGTSQCMGMEVHKVSASMGFELDSLPMSLTEAALTTAVKDSIAATTGLSSDNIGNVTVTVKVKGDTSLTLADAAAATAFAASAAAKTAVEAGIATQAQTTPASVTATLAAARRLTAEDGARRLQAAGTVTAAYEVDTDGVSSSRTMLDNMGTGTVQSDLAGHITTALAASADTTVSAMTPTVASVSAAPKVTVSYEMSSTNATAAAEAQATMQDAAAAGAGQTALVDGITSSLLTAGVEVNISDMSGTVNQVEATIHGTSGNATNAAASSRTPTSSAVRPSLRHVAMSVIAAVAGALSF